MRLAEMSKAWEEMPVKLASGRARLLTSPERNGSASDPTIGIVDVARIATVTVSVDQTTMTSTCSRTSSSAYCCSNALFALASRRMISTFWPST